MGIGWIGGPFLCFVLPSSVKPDQRCEKVQILCFLKKSTDLVEKILSIAQSEGLDVIEFKDSIGVSLSLRKGQNYNQWHSPSKSLEIPCKLDKMIC